MNRKGFTLVEMLAVIVILAIIGGIATIGVISTINNSKLKSEQIFVDKISNLIDDYLDLHSSKLSPTSDTHIFNKCKDASCTNENTYQVEATRMLKSDGTKIYLKDLVDNNIIEQEKLINPKNKEQCLSGTGPEIIIYKDTDYVYHYYVNLTGTNTTCDISAKNGIINTLPADLKSKVGLS